jgi:hypothetical protein
MEDQPENLEGLDHALDEMENKLNLTADEKENGFPLFFYKSSL